MGEKNTSDFLKDDYNPDILEIVTPSGDGFSMYVTPRFTLSYAQGYERFSTRIVRNFVKKCDLFVDVGANYGYYSLLAAEANKAIKIIAVEPIEENFEVLNKNLIHNNISTERVKCINAAVSSISGRIKFYKPEASDSSNDLPYTGSGTLEQLETDAVRLDDILENEQFKSLFIKTHTDGNELEVIKGLSSTYDKCDDITILLKLNPKMLKLAGSSCKEILEYLYAWDFNLYAIDDIEFRYYPLDGKGILEMMCGIYERSCFNVLCVKRNKALSVVFFAHLETLGGAERSLVDLVRDLSERGVLCTAILPAEGPLMDTLKDHGCAIYVLSKWEGLKGSWWWSGKNINDYSKSKITSTFDVAVNRIVPELKKISPDVIFSQTIVSPWGAVCASKLGIPHALSAREYGVPDHNLQFFFGFQESMNALYESSDAVFCITNDVRNTLFGTDKDKKTIVVYSDVKVDIERKASIDKKPDSTFDADWDSGVRVGIFSNIYKGKGQEDLVNACIELSQKGLNIKCILAGSVGDKDYLELLYQIINESEFSERFTRYDFTDDPYRLMKEVDIVVSCARMEALGRTLIEAILIGKPIIYANTGGFKEVFIDGLHGLAYDVGDPHGLANNILFTINNKQETQKRILSAWEYVKHKFNSENYAGKIKEKLNGLKDIKLKEVSPKSVIGLMNISGIGIIPETLLQPKLYYAEAVDRFNEEQSVLTEKIPYGLFSIDFILPVHGFNCLRLDPAESDAVELKIYKMVITTERGEIIVDPGAEIYSNGVNTDRHSWRFFNIDPQLFIKLEINVKSIKFIGEIKRIDIEEIIEELNQKNEKPNQKNVELNQILTSKSCCITKPLRFISGFFK